MTKGGEDTTFKFVEVYMFLENEAERIQSLAKKLNSRRNNVYWSELRNYFTVMKRWSFFQG